tara:strand:- start:7565 stop:7792 length:228 start_codon:yes stop_codon:yes gene_type:complete
MGKKRKMIANPQKYGHKYQAHPAMAKAKADTEETAPQAQPEPPPVKAKKEEPKAKKLNRFKNLAKKTTTSGTDKE